MLAPNKLLAAVPTFITKFGKGPSTNPDTFLSPHEYLARGWDAHNNMWRSVLWPALDKYFRAADLERTAPVWKIQWKKDPPAIGTATGP
jgi:hypothetical protein